MPAERSWLFAAADQPGAVEHASSAGADILILDLEDLVPPTKKDAAREALRQVNATTADVSLYVRINGLASGLALKDTVAAMALTPALKGVVLPKAETPSDLLILDWLLTELEIEHKLATGSLAILAIIETARSFHNFGAATTTLPTRPVRFGLGIGDLATELNLRGTGDETEFAYFRSHLVNTSRALNLLPPIDAVWLDTGDTEGLVIATQRTQAFGFAGKFCLTTDQAEIINRVLSPSKDEIARAERIIQTFDAAKAQGVGAIEVDGMFVDEPVANRFRHLLRQAGQLQD